MGGIEALLEIGCVGGGVTGLLLGALAGTVLAGAARGFGEGF